MKREWDTTYSTDPVSVPIPPEGDGWRLVGAIGAKVYDGTNGSDRALYVDGVVWYWEREVKEL